MPGPTQILSDASSSCDPSAVLESLDAAMRGRVPSKPSDAKIDKNTFDFKEFRVKTKNLLSALCNSIQQLDGDFKMNRTRPEHLLQPCGRRFTRVRMLNEELQMWARPDEDVASMGTRFFLFDEESGSSQPDWYQDETFLRFCTSSDEGSEASQRQIAPYK